ncbi:hypothetical protein L195_g048879, partial [Trifolium pratense]
KETLKIELMQSEQIGQSDPAGSKLSSEGCDFTEKSDPQNCGIYACLYISLHIAW